jgi:hypothetical protein
LVWNQFKSRFLLSQPAMAKMAVTEKMMMAGR